MRSQLHHLRRFFLLICVVFVVVGCSSKKATDSPAGTACEGFPPPAGERWTYRIVGTSYTFTFITEKIDGPVGGYTVYRSRRTDWPPGLGDYIGCIPSVGLVLVAADWWDVGNPSHNGRDYWDPPEPLALCEYGADPGTIAKYAQNGSPDTVVWEVICYENVTVPFGTFRNAQKVRVTFYEGEEIDNNLPPVYDWIDENIGLIKEEEIDSGEAIELIDYSPAGS